MDLNSSSYELGKEIMLRKGYKYKTYKSMDESTLNNNLSYGRELWLGSDIKFWASGLEVCLGGLAKTFLGDTNRNDFEEFLYKDSDDIYDLYRYYISLNTLFNNPLKYKNWFINVYLYNLLYIYSTEYATDQKCLIIKIKNQYHKVLAVFPEHVRVIDLNKEYRFNEIEEVYFSNSVIYNKIKYLDLLNSDIYKDSLLALVNYQLNDDYIYLDKINPGDLVICDYNFGICVGENQFYFLHDSVLRYLQNIYYYGHIEFHLLDLKYEGFERLRNLLVLNYKKYCERNIKCKSNLGETI